jgi:hypothetical protein
VQQVACRDAIDVGEPSIRLRVRVESCQQFEQAMVGAVCDRNRQRFLIESFDVTADNIAQQPVHAALLGLVPAQTFEFLLEVPEGSQPVMLVRKPRIKVVHFSLFK